MSFWTEVHWSEGMFLRPHHLQTAQRWFETVLNSGLDYARPYNWGFASLSVAQEPLENFTLRLDECTVRLKDGTWLKVPENTEVAPRDLKKVLDAAHGGVDVFLGVPQLQSVRANSVPLEHPENVSGTPRYEPQPAVRRDENTGENPQTIYVRRMRGRVFVADEDMTGFETVRIGRVHRTDKPGAAPEFDSLGVGPVLAIQASPDLSRMFRSLADQIVAKGDILAREAREHRMHLSDGMAANMEHLLKLHALNEARGIFGALLQSPLLHPYDVFALFGRVVGHLSVFHDELVPPPLPVYDHDNPALALDRLRARIELLLDALRPMAYFERKFARKRDARGTEGLEVELDRAWIDQNLELYVGLSEEGKEIQEVEQNIYGRLNLKLASPSRAPRIENMLVRGLRLEIKSVPAGTLPRRSGLHYFRINKTIGQDGTDYWKECEQERGIRVSLQGRQLTEFEKFQPTLYIVLKSRS